MSGDYMWDRSGPQDPDVAELERLLAPLAHDRPLDELRVRRRRRAPWIIGAGAVAVAAAVAVYVLIPRDPGAACTGGEGFAFAGDGGSVQCGGKAVASGVLPIGGTLETGANGAKLEIATIGTAALSPGTRVRLERSDAERHQLALERGKLHAKVVAPPRLFAVTTKHTDVIDLGCEYTIEVDDKGVGSICVVDGLVELATASGIDVVAPEGTCAPLLAGQRPGLPVSTIADARVRAAATVLDTAVPGSDAAKAAVDEMLAAAQERDAITLMAVAAIDASQRRRILERLYETTPPPDVEVTVDSATEDPAMFAIWQRDIAEVHAGVYAPKKSR